LALLAARDADGRLRVIQGHCGYHVGRGRGRGRDEGRYMYGVIRLGLLTISGFRPRNSLVKDVTMAAA
jgi:hypothetical protein